MRTFRLRTRRCAKAYRSGLIPCCGREAYVPRRGYSRMPHELRRCHLGGTSCKGHVLRYHSAGITRTPFRRRAAVAQPVEHRIRNSNSAVLADPDTCGCAQFQWQIWHAIGGEIPVNSPVMRRSVAIWVAIAANEYFNASSISLTCSARPSRPTSRDGPRRPSAATICKMFIGNCWTFCRSPAEVVDIDQRGEAKQYARSKVPTDLSLCAGASTKMVNVDESRSISLRPQKQCSAYPSQRPVTSSRCERDAGL